MKGFITNDWDRDNLNFLLKSPTDVLEEWNAQADADDLEYAQELLNSYAMELALEAQDLKVEAQMSLMFEFKDAKQVLDAITKR